MSRVAISIARLHELFCLDAEAGKLYWRVKRYRASAGDEVGCDHRGYRITRLGGHNYGIHRIIFAMTRGYWPADQIDHINCVKDDNRPENLREATHAENTRNIGKFAGNTSGVKGVYWDKKRSKWHAQISINGKQTALGRYDDLALAELVVSEARRKHHGEFARAA